MFEPISTLTQRLTRAGFHVGKLQGEQRVNPAHDGGEAGAAQVEALIAAEKRIRDAGLTFAADKLRHGAIFLIEDDPNYVMSTSAKGVMINVKGAADVQGDRPLTGAPWSRIEAIEAVRAGEDVAQAEAAMLEGAAVHEAGHVLDFAASRDSDDMEMAKSLVAAIKHPSDARAISRYASESGSPEEASAEAFSKAVYGRPLPKALAAWKARVLAFAAKGGRF